MIFHPRARALIVTTALALFLAGSLWLAGRREETAGGPVITEDGETALPADAPAAVPASTDNWGLSFQQEVAAPVGNATAEELARYDAWYLGDTGKKVIYLTFDCGYENGYTGQILDALKKHHAPAAFFVVGNMVETAPDIIRRMAAEGHIVGNHTYHHPDMSKTSIMMVFSPRISRVSMV